MCFILFFCVDPMAGTEQGVVANAHALGMLERMAHLVPTNDEATVLTAFHAANDQHIFRILASIANPIHMSQARRRVLDELSKCKRLWEMVHMWLVHMCAMDSSLSAGQSFSTASCWRRKLFLRMMCPPWKHSSRVYKQPRRFSGLVCNG